LRRKVGEKPSAASAAMPRSASTYERA
jgi:hypothetical protein